LARCLYREAEIYLIDDPFAAVDPTVAKKIAYSVKNYLSKKTRVVVTHQAEYLQGASQFYETKNGQINQVDPSQIDQVKPKLDEVEPKESMVEVNLKNNAESNTKPTENVIQGKMGFKIYVEYLSLALPFIFFIGYILFEFTALGLTYFSDVLLKFWIADVEAYVASCEALKDQNMSRCDPSIPLLEVESSKKWKFWFILLNSIIPFACGCARVSLFRLLTVTNMSLHSRMIKGIMTVPISFFEKTSPGVIMNRFSKDIGQIDDMLPICFSDAINILLQTLIILG